MSSYSSVSSIILWQKITVFQKGSKKPKRPWVCIRGGGECRHSHQEADSAPRAPVSFIRTVLFFFFFFLNYFIYWYPAKEFLLEKELLRKQKQSPKPKWPFYLLFTHYGFLDQQKIFSCSHICTRYLSILSQHSGSAFAHLGAGWATF